MVIHKTFIYLLCELNKEKVWEGKSTSIELTLDLFRLPICQYIVFRMFIWKELHAIRKQNLSYSSK